MAARMGIGEIREVVQVLQPRTDASRGWHIEHPQWVYAGRAIGEQGVRASRMKTEPSNRSSTPWGLWKELDLCTYAQIVSLPPRPPLASRRLFSVQTKGSTPNLHSID